MRNSVRLAALRDAIPLSIETRNLDVWFGLDRLGGRVAPSAFWQHSNGALLTRCSFAKPMILKHKECRL